MLSLKPPYLASGHLILFQDDKDSTCFYYVNQHPHLSRDENGKPCITAYCILPESGAVVNPENILEAGLNLDVDLGVTKEELDAAKQDIQKHFGSAPKILSPAPLHSGKVRFAMADSAGEGDDSKWYITSEVSPSMFGSNRVSLALRTSGREAKLLIAAASEGAISACVFYELELVGITPVYHAKIHAEMNTIYNRLRNRKKDNFIFYTEEVDKLLQELKDEKVLTIEVEETDPDIKTSAIASIMNDLKKQVIDRFFEPVALLSDTKSDSGSFYSGFLSSLIPARHVLKSSIHEEQLKNIDVDLNQSNAKTTPFCPSSFLKSMIDDAGIDMADYITWIRLDELLFFNQTLSVRISADTFESSNIKDMLVTCRVVDTDTGEMAMEPISRSFTAKDGITSWDMNFNRQRGHKYGYEYKVCMYMTTSSTLLPDRLETDWKRIDSPYIYINPAEHYKNFELDLNLNDLTVFEQAQMIEAKVSVVHKDDEVVLDRQLFFSRDDYVPKKLCLVADRSLPLHYVIRLKYFLTGDKEHLAEYTGINDQFFFIPNPFENRWSVDIACKADWTSVVRVYLDTRIKDAERADAVTDHFVFSSDRQDARLNAAVSVDTPDRQFEYMITRYDAEGKTVKAGWFQHDGSPILLICADQVKSERVYNFRIGDPANWSRFDLQKALISFKYEVSGKEEEYSDQFKSPDQVMRYNAPWEAELFYRITLKGEDGEVVGKSSWEAASSDNVEIVLKNIYE